MAGEAYGVTIVSKRLRQGSIAIDVPARPATEVPGRVRAVAIRLVVGGALALAATYLVGTLLGASGIV